MNSEQRNLFLALAVFLLVYWGSGYFWPKTPVSPAEPPAAQETSPDLPTPPSHIDLPQVAAQPAPRPTSKKVRIETPRLSGSIDTRGARLDDLTLTEYHETVSPESPEITLLQPEQNSKAFYVQHGWRSPDAKITLPTADTTWHADQDVLTPQTPLTLTWTNPEGVKFSRTISLDEQYMFTIVDTIRNGSDHPLTLNMYGLTTRIGRDMGEKSAILHEGPLGVINDRLEEVTYADLWDEKKKTFSTKGGWIGIGSKYWAAVMIPDQSQTYEVRFVAAPRGNEERFQVDYLGPSFTVAPGASHESTQHLFAGAKSLELLDAYEKTLGVPKLDRLIDFGILYFVTKPLFYVLNAFHTWLGNFGLAILLLTILIKAIFFPLANKSYRSMRRMKDLQPKMEALRARYGDDKMALSQATMELYKQEKINPVSGCLPMIVQIPIFFALYKVLYISLEMRHAPFYGWIHDLSAPDPTTIFNLFGLIPWTPPSFLMIGIWPLLMGLTMFLQQRMSPPSADPAQAKMFMVMPLIFVFIFGSFPAGLVIYWTWSNLLSILQQWVIMHGPAPATPHPHIHRKKK